MVHTIRRSVLRVMFCGAFGAPISACSPEGTQALSDGAYIRVMAELLILSDSALGEPTDSARAGLLERLGVSEAQVLEFADAAGRDPERMERLWTAIQAVVDSVQIASDSLASAPSETRLGSMASERAIDDTAGPGSAPDTASRAAPLAPADSSKIRRIRERMERRGVRGP